MATFTFDQLEAFATVVEQGSFSAAARKLKKRQINGSSIGCIS